MILADDLLTFFVKSSVEEQDNWLRDSLLKNNGLLGIRIDGVVKLRDGVILTPYRSSGDTTYHSRVLFEDATHPIVKEHAEHRALELTQDAQFSALYAEHSVGFRHYTDASVIRLTCALYRRALDFKSEFIIDATKVVDGLTSLVSCPIRPDFRRSVYAIKLAKLMTGGKVNVNDMLWMRSHRDLFEYMRLEKDFSFMLEEGFRWYMPPAKESENTATTFTYRTAGLSALSYQEVELRFKLSSTDSRLAETVSVIHDNISDALKEEVVKFGLQTLDMKRAIKRIIKAHTDNLSYCEKENYDALVSSVYPRKILSFTINLK